MSDEIPSGYVDERETRDRSRGWIGKLLLALGSILFAFMMGELILHLVYTPQVPTIPQAVYHHTRPTDSPYRWTSVHDEFDMTVSFNSLALRGSEPDLSKENLWLFMGDSLIEALQVSEEQTVTRFLETNLGEDHTVLNAGVGGYSPLLMYLRLKELLEQLAPKTPQKILLGIFPNDLEEEYVYRSAAYRDAEGHIFAVTPGVMRGPIGRLRTSLFQYSMIFQIIQRTFIGGEGRVAQPKINPYLPSENVIFPFRNQWTDAEREIWSRVFRSIGDIERLCHSKGIELILVIIPPGHQIGPDVWKTGKQAMNFPEDFQVQNTTFQNEILTRARRIGVRAIDLLPDLKEHPSPEDLYFDFDGHWTAEGNRFAAEIILKKLNEDEEDEENP